jgi:hypothetical protein
MGVRPVSDFTPLGYTWNGNFYLLGREGPVTIEEFNEVVGGPIGDTGWTVSFGVSEDDDE